MQFKAGNPFFYRVQSFNGVYCDGFLNVVNGVRCGEDISVSAPSSGVRSKGNTGQWAEKPPRDPIHAPKREVHEAFEFTCEIGKRRGIASAIVMGGILKAHADL